MHANAQVYTHTKELEQRRERFRERERKRSVQIQWNHTKIIHFFHQHFFCLSFWSYIHKHTKSKTWAMEIECQLTHKKKSVNTSTLELGERTKKKNCCLHILQLYLALELLLFTLLHCKSGDDHITPYIHWCRSLCLRCDCVLLRAVSHTTGCMIKILINPPNNTEAFCSFAFCCSISISNYYYSIFNNGAPSSQAQRLI